MKRIILLVTVALVMAAMMVASGMPAFAQDPQGKVEQGTEQANSICSFSGLNDEPEADFPEGGQVQSYGQLVKQGQKDEFPSPGEACNPTNPPPEE